MNETPANQEVDQFILDWIESVPHLEALLLLWNSRPKAWTIDEMARRLYARNDFVRQLLQDLAQEQLITFSPGPPETYAYSAESAEKDRVIGLVDATYRREVVRISNMIHSKPPSAVRDFARAFRFKKE